MLVPTWYPYPPDIRTHLISVPTWYLHPPDTLTHLIPIPTWYPYPPDTRAHLIPVPTWYPYPPDTRAHLIPIPTWYPYPPDSRAHLIPVRRCQFIQTLLSMVSTSTAWRTLGRLTLSGSVAPQPATTAFVLGGVAGSGSGRQTGDTCAIRLAGRSSLSSARS